MENFDSSSVGFLVFGLVSFLGAYRCHRDLIVKGREYRQHAEEVAEKLGGEPITSALHPADYMLVGVFVLMGLIFTGVAIVGFLT